MEKAIRTRKQVGEKWMVWVCKQHGKSCKSYVVGICKDFNDWKITPKNIDSLDAETKQFSVCVKWVKENE